LNQVAQASAEREHSGQGSHRRRRVQQRLREQLRQEAAVSALRRDKALRGLQRRCQRSKLRLHHIHLCASDQQVLMIDISRF